MKAWKIGDHNPLSFQVDYDRPNIFHLGDYEKETKLATPEEKAAQSRMRPSTSFFKDSCKRFAKNPVAMVSFVIVLLLILVISYVPPVCPEGYKDTLHTMYKINKKNDT